jgi:hypothetical protein
VWRVSAIITRPGEEPRTSNTIAFLLAPEITASNVTRPAGVLTIKLTVRPEVWPQQKVTVVVGERELAAEPHAAKTADLTFLATGTNDPGAGTYPVRLRVDGVESHLIDRTQTPPRFDPTQKVTLP